MPPTAIPPTPLPTLTPVPTAAPTPAPTAAPNIEPTATPTATPRPIATVEISLTGTPVDVKFTLQRVIFGIDAPGTESVYFRDGRYAESILHRPEYEHLLGMDPVTGAMMPELAESWELLPDGLSYRVKLREGVQFHHGWGEFYAWDVIDTHNRLIRNRWNPHSDFPWWNGLSEVQYVSDHEVIFRLSRPSGRFLTALSGQLSMMPIQSKAHFDARGERADAESPFIAGTGPYQMQKRETGEYIRFERPETPHWRDTPDFEEFEFRFQALPSHRLAALLAGETHIADLPYGVRTQVGFGGVLQNRDYQKEAIEAGMQVARGWSPSFRTWMKLSCCWVDPVTGAYPARPDSPLTNPVVRRALSKAVDRNLLNETFFRGKAETMYINHWHPTRLGWNPAWESDFPEQYGYDPVAARALLSKVGYFESNKVEVNVDLPSVRAYLDAGKVSGAITNMLRAVGVKVNSLVRHTLDRQAAERSFGNDNHLLVTTSTSNLISGFVGWHTPMYHETNSTNVPELTSLASRALNATTPEEHALLWTELGNMYYDSYLSIPLFWFPAEATYNPELISDYVFPGSLPGTWTHIQNIRAAQ